MTHARSSNSSTRTTSSRDVNAALLTPAPGRKATPPLHHHSVTSLSEITSSSSAGSSGYPSAGTVLTLSVSDSPRVKSKCNAFTTLSGPACGGWGTTPHSTASSPTGVLHLTPTRLGAGRTAIIRICATRTPNTNAANVSKIEVWWGQRQLLC